MNTVCITKILTFYIGIKFKYVSTPCTPYTYNAYILKNILYISLHNILSIDTNPDRTLVFIYIYAIINIIINRTSHNILIIVFNCVARNIILGRVATLNKPTSIYLLQILYNDRNNCQIIYNNFITIQ